MQEWGNDMIKALLVEDESITRKGLMKHIHWSDLGIDEIRSEGDAETALKISLDYKPNIIISDIKMRGIDGIEMCRTLKERLPDCQVIFISSYAQKEYLKAAIKLEAVHYVEKPIDLEELSSAIQMAVKRYQSVCANHALQLSYETSVRHIKNETFLSLLRGRNNHEDTDIILRIGGLWNDNCVGFRICIIHWPIVPENTDLIIEWYLAATGLQSENNGMYVHGEFWDNKTMIVYIATEGNLLEEKGQLLLNMQKLAKVQDKEQVHFLAIGKMCRSLNDLTCSYQSALSALQCLSFLGYGASATYQESYHEWQSDLDQEEERSLKMALRKKDVKEVNLIINRLFDRFLSERVILNSVVRNISLMIYNDIREEKKNCFGQRHRNNTSKGEYTYILEKATTLQEIKELLLEYVEETMEEKNMEGQGSNILIKQVIVYMNRHYQEKDLTINRMAEEVFLAPTYLSILFKQDTGMTINQYLTKLRIEYAKTFLLNPELKLYQVANKVGYEDAAYFNRIFKNQIGMTPSEYKEKNIL